MAAGAGPLCPLSLTPPRPRILRAQSVCTAGTLGSLLRASGAQSVRSGSIHIQCAVYAWSLDARAGRVMWRAHLAWPCPCALPLALAPACALGTGVWGPLV